MYVTINMYQCMYMYLCINISSTCINVSTRSVSTYHQHVSMYQHVSNNQHLHVYASVYIHACISNNQHLHVYVSMYQHVMYQHVSVYQHVCINRHLHVYACIWKCKSACICMFICILDRAIRCTSEPNNTNIQNRPVKETYIKERDLHKRPADVHPHKRASERESSCWWTVNKWVCTSANYTIYTTNTLAGDATHCNTLQHTTTENSVYLSYLHYLHNQHTCSLTLTHTDLDCYDMADMRWHW